jgi:hypothetical protein
MWSLVTSLLQVRVSVSPPISLAALLRPPSPPSPSSPTPSPAALVASAAAAAAAAVSQAWAVRLEVPSAAVLAAAVLAARADEARGPEPGVPEPADRKTAGDGSGDEGDGGDGGSVGGGDEEGRRVGVWVRRLREKAEEGGATILDGGAMRVDVDKARRALRGADERWASDGHIREDHISDPRRGRAVGERWPYQ